MIRRPEFHTARTIRRSQQRVVLAICCLSMLIAIMDMSAVNVALPSIQRDLVASVTDLQWVVDAYTVIIASLLILSGAAADRFGRRKVFQLGLSIFGIASMCCALAPNISALVAARAVQAVGGSMLNPVAMAIVATTFTERHERAQAIGIFGGMSGVALGLGPVLGGQLVDGSDGVPSSGSTCRSCW